MALTRLQSTLEWLKQNQDIVALVAERLLSDDLGSFVRLRSACKYWRRATDHLAERAGLILPRNWILLSASASVPQAQAAAVHLHFLNTASGKSFSRSVSFPHHGFSPSPSLASAVGCFLLLEKTNADHSTTRALLNPFNGTATQLPPFVVSPTGLPSLPFPTSIKGGHATSTGAIFFVMGHPLVSCLLWKPYASDTWFYADVGISCFNYFFDKDFFYGMEFGRGLVRLNLVSVEIATDCSIETLAPPPLMQPDQVVEYAYIFNCDGAIILVLFWNNDSGDYSCYEKFDVFKFNARRMKFVGTKNINKHAIFISTEKTLSVPRSRSVDVPANSIILCNLTGEVLLHDVPQNRDEPYFPQSNTIAGRLVKYCSDDLDG